jgi:hypothetical protein
MEQSSRRHARRSVLGLASVLAGLCASSQGFAQELTPRAYWPAPRGTTVAVVGYSHVSGDEVLDPSIPLNAVDSRVSSGILAYLHTFSLWGRTTNVVAELPYSRGIATGLVGETPARSEFSGFGDLGLTLAVNLLGAPSLTPAEFQALRVSPRPILGASLKVLVPTGSYDSDRLINVGGHRWAARMELGSVIPLTPRWLLELAAGAWFFGDDEDYLPGRREQDPIIALQAHLVRRFRPGLWASLDANFFSGGRQTIGCNRLADARQNSRVGATLVAPFGGRHAIKVGYFVGAHTEFGGDYDQFFAAYQVVFR